MALILPPSGVMRILVTGGTGVVGRAAVTELAQHGHFVRLLSRNALQDARRWGDRVEPWPGSVSSEADVRGSADGVDVVLHVAGVVAESPPEVTFEGVNVVGTRNVLREAERAGTGRFVFLSSLGAEAGTSPYHRSKREGEALVREFRGGWIILRPGNVYGPGDEVVSLLLRMVRTLPAIPVVAGGDDRFQPVWVEDLARAIARAVERPDLHGRVLPVAGEDVTSTNDLLDRMARITGRAPGRVPVPAFLASAGAALADLVGMQLPVNASQLTMLREGNVIRADDSNALTTVFGLEPTSLEEGLRRLSESQPEQLPGEGIGALRRKRIWADITGSRLTPEQLFESFRRDFDKATPWVLDAAAEPGANPELRMGGTLTMSLPVRGNIQVRVEELTPVKATLVTLAGHPLAGAVRFLAEQRGDQLRFETQVYDKPASIADWFMMKAVGDVMQARTWDSLVQRMVSESGGTAPLGVEHSEDDVSDERADRIDDWLRDLVIQRGRAGEANEPREPDSRGSDAMPGQSG